MTLLLAALFSTAQASDLEVRDVRGRAVSVEDHTVVFWSTGCASCVDTLASFARAGQPVVAVNVDAAAARSTLVPFLASRGLGPSAGLTVVADPTGAVARHLGVAADRTRVGDGAVVVRGPTVGVATAAR